MMEEPIKVFRSLLHQHIGSLEITVFTDYVETEITYRSPMLSNDEIADLLEAVASHFRKLRPKLKAMDGI